MSFDVGRLGRRKQEQKREGLTFSSRTMVSEKCNKESESESALEG